MISLIIPAQKESAISWTAFFTTATQRVVSISFGLYWILKGFPTIDHKEFVLFATHDYSFFVDFLFVAYFSIVSGEIKIF